MGLGEVIDHERKKDLLGGGGAGQVNRDTKRGG